MGVWEWGLGALGRGEIKEEGRAGEMVSTEVGDACMFEDPPGHQ